MSRLLFIQPKLQGVGGIEKVIPLIVGGMDKLGHKVSVAIFYGFVPQSLSCKNYTHKEKSEVSIFGKLVKIVKRFVWLRKIIKEDNPEVIIVSAHGAVAMVLALKLIKLIKVPVLIYEHQSLAVSDVGYGWLRKWLYNFADGFIAVSKGVLRELSDKFTKIPNTCVYNPILPVAFKSAIPNKPVFVTASRLEYVKGIDILVELFIGYKKLGGDGELLIYGEGALLESAEESVAEARLNESIKFMGVTQSLTNELRSATAYISCARKESLGVSLLEALSVGVPLVCLDVPYGPREIMEVEPGVPLQYPLVTTVGILFGNLNDTSAFCESLRLIDEKRADFTEPALVRASDFSVEAAVKDIDLFLSKVKSKYE